VSFLSEKQLTRALQAAFNEARIKIRSNIKWFAQNSKSVSDWLDSYDYDLKRKFIYYSFGLILTNRFFL
jgi:hypothetical protein